MNTRLRSVLEKSIYSFILYYLLGRFGLMFALEPGYVTPVWLPSGLALVASLVWPRHSLLGIFLGSVLLNHGLHPEAPIGLAFTIGIGSAMTAWFASELIRRRLKFPEPFTRDSDVAIYFLVAGPLSHLLSASWGSVSLLAFAAISKQEFFKTWYTWWIGDSLGAILFAPLALIWMVDVRRNWLRWILAVIIPLGATYTISIFIYFYSIKSEEHKVLTDFHKKSELSLEALNRTMETYFDILYAVETHFRRDPNLSYSEFANFSSLLRQKRKAIQAISWNQIVTENDRTKFEARAIKNGFADFHIKEKRDGVFFPVRPRDTYFPVYYIDPLKPNAGAVGFDLGSDKIRRDAIDEFLKSSHLTATAPIKLVQFKENNTGVLLFLPVSDHRGQLLGFISGVIRISEVIDEISHPFNAGTYHLRLADVTKGEVDLFDTRTAQGSQASATARKWASEFAFAGRTWKYETFHITPRFAGYSAFSYLILFGALIFSLLLGTLLLLITYRSIRVERIVLERTQALRDTNRKLAHASNAKTQFLANMSHEIRTPLNGIVGAISLFETTPLMKLQTEYLEMIKSSSELLLSIINDVLEISKIEAGKLELEIRPFHLRKMIDELGTVLAPSIHAKNLDFIIDIDSLLPDFIQGDEVRIKQILLNLIGNATKFTPSGHIMLSIRTDPGTFKLRFSVSDTGIGIPKDKIETIFSAFSQADISDTRKYGGSGLGLAISKEIATRMGGAIEVQSDEAKGSTFSFTIPLEKADSSETACSRLPKLRFQFLNPKQTEVLERAFSELPGTLENLAEHFVVDLATLNRDQSNFPAATTIVCLTLNERLKFEADTNNLGYKTLTKPITLTRLEDAFLIPQVSTTSNPAAPTLLHGKRGPVLVVDDNEINQKVIRLMLEKSGYQVESAPDGQAAVEMVLSREYDIVLMDCQMPVMDGYSASREIIKNLGANTNRPKIVALTANALRSTKEKCFESGMDDFLTKPVQPKDLIAMIEKHASKSAASNLNSTHSVA